MPAMTLHATTSAPPIRLSKKRQILDAAGYVYDFYHEVYVHRAARKMISAWFVRDHSEEQLEACIREANRRIGRWRFYCNTPPSVSVRRQLKARLA
jgi:hypothetical protein